MHAYRAQAHLHARGGRRRVKEQGWANSHFTGGHWNQYAARCCGCTGSRRPANHTVVQHLHDQPLLLLLLAAIKRMLTDNHIICIQC